MAMITLASTNSNLSQSLSIERCNSNLREASFSSYLNSTEESFVQKLAESSRDLNPGIPKGSDEDEEIGVFGAEKYFNGVIDHEDSTNPPRIAKVINPRKEVQYKKEDDNLDLDSSLRPKMQQPGTPSVLGSESSWNSQSMLLNSIKKNASQNKTKKEYGKSFLGGLGCKCSCSDKNSVDIQEQVGETSFSSRNASSSGSAHYGKGSSKKTTVKSDPELDVLQVNKTHSGSWIRDKSVLNNDIDKMGIVSKRDTNHVTFPALKSHETGKEYHMKIQLENENDQDMQPRKSMGVFGSPICEKRSKSFALDNHKRPTMLNSRDTNSKVKAKLELSGGIYSDCESDASSDLFELESLTGKSDPHLKRQISDVTLSDCVTPCYAPSEASIEWSVVTASAADFSTVCASDYEDQPTMPISRTANNKTFESVPYAGMKENKDGRRKGGPGTFLGCKNLKAVEVAGNHYQEHSTKRFDSRVRRRSDSFVPVSKIQAEYSSKHFDTRHGQIASMSPSHLPMSRTPHP